VRYTITKNGEEFILDTCGTRVNTDSAMWQSVRKIWDFLEISSEQ